MLCNKTFKAFLEDQITKNKPIYSKCKSFLDIVIFFLQYLLSTSLVATHYFKSFITLFKKKKCNWYLTKCFFPFPSSLSTSSNSIFTVKKQC